MATRQLVRFGSRRFSTGKVLGEEEKAAENIYIKKAEQEKLQKLANEGAKSTETPAAAAANAGGSAAEAKASETPTPTPKGVSTDIHRNYAVVAGTITGLSALGWYLLSKDKKTEELQD